MALRPMRFISAATGVERSRNQRKTIDGRKLTALCWLSANSPLMMLVTGATISQKPMIKNPISTGASNRLSTLLSVIARPSTFIIWSKLSFFLGIHRENRAFFYPESLFFGKKSIAIPHFFLSLT